MNSIDYVDNITERHLLGDLLDDEGFGSWKSEDLKPSDNSTDNLILGDVKNSDAYYLQPKLVNTRSYSSLLLLDNLKPSNQQFAPLCSPSSSSLSSGTKFNVNAPEFFPPKKPSISSSLHSIPSQSIPGKPAYRRAELCFMPVGQKKLVAKQKKEQRNNKEASSNPSLTTIVGLNPLKAPGRKDIVAREYDFAKVKPRSAKSKSGADKLNTNGKKPNKSRFSPTNYSSSNENLSVLTSRRFEGKFQALNQLSSSDEDFCTDVFDSQYDDKHEGSECSSESKKTGKGTTSRKSKPAAQDGISKPVKLCIAVALFIFAVTLVKSLFDVVLSIAY